MNPLTLLKFCAQVYAEASIVAGPRGRDGAAILHGPRGETVLVFRGTLTEGESSLADWENDLNAGLVPGADLPGRVHAGFLDSLDTLWPAIAAALDGDDSELWITGHSKGGALAVLAAARLAGRHPGVITFGAPMAGDREFAANALSQGLARYENRLDLVPLLPPLEYAHVGTPVLVGEGPDDHRHRYFEILEHMAEGRWELVATNHSLETGYAPYLTQ